MPTPCRVVSLSPNVSMVLFALEADASVVGRTQGCLAALQQYSTVWRLPEPELRPRLQHWQALPVVGTWPLAEREAIQALQPDLILTAGSGLFGVPDAASLGVAAEAVVHWDVRTFADLLGQIQQLGSLLDRTAQATALGAQLQRKRDEVQARQPRSASPLTVLFEYCVCTYYDEDPERRLAEPARTVLVGGHLAPELIQWSGATPVCVQPGDTARWVAFDEIRQAQPVMILQYDCHGCPTASKHPLPARPGWSALPAVAQNAVYLLRENISDPNLCFPVALEHVAEIVQRHAARVS
ncbi:MAG: ABC transporter substrate-binding protein [Candidatus Tectimicrobiota bacterium]